MPVFACLFPIKELHTHPFFNTSKGKHSLYFADFSFRLLLFSPFLCEPRKGALIHSPRNKPGGLQTTHRAAQGSLSNSFLLLSHTHCFMKYIFLFHSIFFIFLSISISKFHLLSAHLNCGRVKGALPCCMFLSLLEKCVLHLCLFDCAHVNC